MKTPSKQPEAKPEAELSELERLSVMGLKDENPYITAILIYGRNSYWKEPKGLI